MDNAIELPEELQDYIFASSEPVHPVVRRIIAETQAMPERSMQITPDEAIFLRAMVRLIRPEAILEIGTFTGLSSLIMAGAMVDGGRMTCLDISDEFTAIARQAWAEARVADRIDLIIGPALESIAHLDGPFQLVFIDADKENLQAYVEAVIPKVPQGGVVMVDNTLWRRQVITDDASPSTVTIRAFNQWLVAHPAFDVEMVGIADGLTLAIKK
ncbi:MAG: O-methyltransferase [Acidimicrobiia bacterium]|nr:O-methyltransferase [Acidimicrobiia bacterium]